MKGQGSINKDDFYKIIKFIGRNNILDANVFFEKSKKINLKIMKFVLLLMMPLSVK